MSARILLTGASGFIGKAFAAEALGRGYKILALVRDDTNTVSQPGLTYVKGTLQDAPWEEIRRFQPETCVHAAWISTPGLYLEASENRQLVSSSFGLLQGLMELGVRHSVVLGTCIEYAPSDTKLKEESPLGPLSLYARSKTELHNELESSLVPKGLNLAWARIFYPYGVGEHPQRLCSSIITKVLRGEEVILKTPNSVKDYIYITDLAAALLALIEARFSGTINIGTGEGISIQRLASLIAARMNKPELIKVGTPASPDVYPYVVADITKLLSLHWTPKVSLDQGIDLLLRGGGAAQ